MRGMIDQKLLSFMSIVESGSYTEAARGLSLTQPAISHHMRMLEEEYGHKLLTYVGRKLELTEAGKIIYDHAVGASAKEKLLIDRLTAIGNKKREVKFGATLTIGEFTIAPFLSDLFHAFPEYHFSLQVDNTKILMDLLNRGEIHFALIEGLFDKNLYDAQLLKNCDFILIAPKDHQIANKKKVVLEDLLEDHLIIREKGSGSREILERALSERNRSIDSFKDVIEMGNVNIIKKMTMEGMGISFMYRDAALEELQSGKLVDVAVENFKMEREFNFVQRKGLMIPNENQALLDYFHGKMNEILIE